MRCHFISTSVRNNPNGPVGKVPQQSSKGLFEMKNHRVVIGRINVIHVFVDVGLRADYFVLREGIESPLHVMRGERAAVMKKNAVMKMKDVSKRIGYLPAFRQPRFYI